MKNILLVTVIFLTAVALVASETPYDPWGSVPQMHNPRQVFQNTEEHYTLPEGIVSNNPFYFCLTQLSPEERINASIEILFLGEVSAEVEQQASQAEQKWNRGNYDRALALLEELYEMGCEALVGISWRNPIPAPPVDWGTDVQVSSRDSVFVLAFDMDNASENLFAVLGFQGDGAGSHFSVNFSDDGGYTWSETFYLGGFAYIMNDIDGIYCDEHFYVSYTGGYSSDPNEMCWLKRYKWQDGSQDTMPDGSVSYKLFETAVEIEEVDIHSNHDEFDNRLYVAALMADNTIKYYWGYPYQINWSEISPPITDAVHALDACWNYGYGDYSRFMCYINANDSVKIYGRLSSWTMLYKFPVNSSSQYYFTGIGAHQDTILCMFDYYTGGENTIHYLIRYGTGGTWYQGSIASGNNYGPDCTLRGQGGIHTTYRAQSGLAGYYRWRDYYGSWSTAEIYADNDVTGDIKPDIQYIGSGAYGIMYRNPIINPPYGTVLFDRSDAGVAETPVDKPLAASVKLLPNITADISQVSYTITKPGHVHIALYDVSGRVVRTLCDDHRAEGPHQLNINGASLTPGVYFVRISSPNGEMSKKLTVMK